jgi:hypothetical protein
MVSAKYKDSDIVDWPNSWKGEDNDLRYGAEIVKLFKPFIESLKSEDLSQKTINRHIDNLWLLGGHLIGHINAYPKDRKIEPLFLIPQCIDGYDGPYIRDLNDDEQKAFDSTCRKFYKWLVPNRLKPAVRGSGGRRKG